MEEHGPLTGTNDVEAGWTSFQAGVSDYWNADREPDKVEFGGYEAASTYLPQ